MINEKAYTPELGQAFYGCPTEANAMPRYAEALFSEVWRVMAREFGNANQREFDPRGELEAEAEILRIAPRAAHYANQTTGMTALFHSAEFAEEILSKKRDAVTSWEQAVLEYAAKARAEK
jgi:hypothetical protein